MTQSSYALITGASSGIGFELAKCFARQKINLVLVARTTAKLEELARDMEREHGIRAHVIAEPDVANTIFNECRNLGFEIEYLVNNAGFGSFGPFLDTGWDISRRMIDLNIMALTHLTWLFAPKMRERGRGRILNVASTAAFQPGPMMAVYFATKAFVLSFSEALGAELTGSGVTVTALCPGVTESGFHIAAKTDGSRWVKGRRIPSSREVAEYGFDAMMSGDAVAIHGTFNYLLAQSVRFTPRNLVTRIVKTLQS
jgi:short-subunit dehydrogenase